MVWCLRGGMMVMVWCLRGRVMGEGVVFERRGEGVVFERRGDGWGCGG